jgi:hypothetical protein
MLAQNKTMFHSFINIEAINQEKEMLRLRGYGPTSVKSESHQ